jgi:hypothetical protein
LTGCGASKPQSWYWSCTALGALCCYRNASSLACPSGLLMAFVPCVYVQAGPTSSSSGGGCRVCTAWRGLRLRYLVDQCRSVDGIDGNAERRYGRRSADTSAMTAAAKVRAAASAAAGKRLGCSTDGSSLYVRLCVQTAGHIGTLGVTSDHRACSIGHQRAGETVGETCPA